MSPDPARQSAKELHVTRFHLTLPASASALVLTAALAGTPAAAQATSPTATQPHPQPGSVWTAVINGQVARIFAKATDKNGDAETSVTFGGRTLYGLVLHTAKGLSVAFMDGESNWVCMVESKDLKAGAREFNGKGIHMPKNSDDTNGVGACQVFTYDRVPATKPLTWANAAQVNEWEMDTAEGPISIRLTSAATGIWGDKGPTHLTPSNASGAVVFNLNQDGLGIGLNKTGVKGVYRTCLAGTGELKDGVIRGVFGDGSDRGYGTCAVRPAGSGVPQAVSPVPQWPLKLGIGQMWEISADGGLFRGMVGQNSNRPDDYYGGWFGPYSANMQILKLDAGKKDENTVFFIEKNDGTSLACVIAEARYVAGLPMEQFGTDAMRLTQQVHGILKIQPPGKQQFEDKGACWVRPLVGGLAAGLK